jgi:hypothetical protein
MGAAGTGILDSDAVADFVYEFEESGNVNLLRSLLEHATGPHVQNWEAGIVAAVYLVAVTRSSYASSDDARTITNRLAAKGIVVPTEFVDTAHNAIVRVIQETPASNWFKESDYSDWKQNLRELEICLANELKQK